MIGTFLTIDGVQVYDKLNGQLNERPPLKLHSNFYRAMSEARAYCNGRYITINTISNWALVGNDDASPMRILITEE